MRSDAYWAIREAGTGIVTFLLVIVTAALGKYIYNHRLTLTVEERDARDAAIGLGVFFGALGARGMERWWMSVAERHGLPFLPGTGSTEVYLVILALTLFGAVLTLRAFHPWPMWATLLALAVVVPIVTVLL